MSAVARKHPETTLTGHVIADRYRIERALGVGGAAQVFCVTDLARGGQLALKQLQADASAKLRALFELEFHTLAGLRHPNIVQVYDYGRDEAAAFYTMELLQGEDLRARAPLPFREACEHLLDAARALTLLHARRLVHRDISPRNLWRTPAGKIKLIDFGALSPFGVSGQVIGTPPFVAFEAFHGLALDQRTDLYSLGAVAYYLLTGLHAYPARTLAELPERWAELPLPPSQHVAQLARADLPAIPVELDDLVKTLLSQTPLARPSSGAEVIDRLETLLGGTDRRPAIEGVAHAHLASPVFVGRTAARRRLRRQLTLASHGRNQSCVIESEPGFGRSRLLSEFAIEAQLAAATVLHVDATGVDTHFGVASALSLALLDALPEAARTAAAPLTSALAGVSVPVRKRLQAVATSAEPSRVRIQGALRDWFLRVAQAHTLVVLVDGLELVDEATLAFLLALAEAHSGARLLLACSTVRVPGRPITPAERMVRKASRSVSLGALNNVETYELLHSVFGDTDSLERLAMRLRQATRGSPGHTLELCAEWVRRDVIGFADGTWVLPREFPEELLCANREQRLRGRLDLLSEQARELGRALSMHAEVSPHELVSALAHSVSDGALSHLEELLTLEIVVRQDDGLRFVNPELRRLLQRELEAPLRARAQRALGEFLWARAGEVALQSLTAGVHLLESGDPRGGAIVAGAALQIVMHEADNIKPAAPLVEVALRVLREQRRPPRELLTPLALLSVAGFSADRAYALRHGEATVAAMREVLGLRIADKLRVFLGKKLSILIALIVAGVRLGRYRKDPRVPSFKDCLALLFNSMATLAGSSALCLDADGAKRFASVVEPFAALGKDQIAGFLAEFCRTSAQGARDYQESTWRSWRDLLTQLESGSGVRGMTDSMRKRFVGGALYTMGVIESQRDGEAALRIAERLDEVGLSLYSMGADQLRTVYYANQGNLDLSETYRVRVEHHAAQQGTSWQVETWVPTAMLPLALRTHDALLAKRAAEMLQRLSLQMASLDRLARRARGAYLLLRGSFTKALPWLEEILAEPPRASVGWARMHGVLALAYNRLGKHERALSTCMRVYEHFSEADFAFSPVTLTVQTERLIAEAAMGDALAASQKLDLLIAQHEPNKGPLTMGGLHAAGISIARSLGDEARERAHFAELQRWYLATDVPSLVQYCTILRQQVQPDDAQARVSRMSLETPGSTATTNSGRTGGALTVDRMLAGGSLSSVERARKALQILAEHTRTSAGQLFLLREGDPVLAASLHAEERLPTEVERWIGAQLARELDDDMKTEAVDADTLEGETNVLQHEGRCYRSLLLLDARSREQGVVGLAVVSSKEGIPSACSTEVLSAVGYHLQRAIEQDRAPAPSADHA